MTYIDPGAGSIIIQVVLGALVAISFALKLFWSKIKIFFKKVFRRG
jgi:hypothetical protein